MYENGTKRPAAPGRAVQQKVIDITENASLTQVHRDNTRENALLDLVFTTNPTLVRNSVSIPGISDHDMVITDIDTKPQYIHQQKRKCFIFSRADWNGLNDELRKIHEAVKSMMSKEETINTIWNFFKQSIMTSANKFIPIRMRGGTHRSPWITQKIKKMLSKKKRLYNQAKKNKNWKNYRVFQRECKRAIRQAEWNHVNRVIEEGFRTNNNKPFWKYIKSKKQDNVGVAPLCDNGKLYNDSKSKARILLQQFKSVFTPPDERPLTPSQSKSYPHIKGITINKAGIVKLLKEINPAKACGPDAIPNMLLKNCADAIAPSLADIFQLSLDSGSLPDDWRKANISSIYKKGDRHQAANYRPVSLTSVCCKLLEHVICKHLMNHLEKNNILTNLNHGFRSGFSCETQLLTTTHDIFKSFDKGKQVDVAILDFSKAFDTVPHRTLLHRLEQYGVKGTIHTWLTNFLTKRTMSVVLDGESSDEVPVISGVPQGTVLGPILFLCHINDLPLNVKSQVRLFADDCLLYREINNQTDHNILQNDLNQLETWADKSGMQFNAKKCYILSVKSKRSYFYNLSGTILQQVPHNPYLGIQISEDLKWHTHISNVTNKASSTLGFLRRNLKTCPQESRRLAYLALIRPILEYGSAVWDSHYKTDIERIERIQNRAARFIKQDYRSRDPGCITTMLHDLQLPSLQDRRRQLRLTQMYKVVEKLVPAMPPDHFFQPKPAHKRQIKSRTYADCVTSNIVDRSASNNSKSFIVPHCNTDQYKHSFFVQTVLDWNQLDDSVVSAKTVECFKSRLC